MTGGLSVGVGVRGEDRSVRWSRLGLSVLLT